MVSKVDGFHLTSQASFADHLRLTRSPIIAVSPHSEQDDLVESSPSISEEFENDLLAT
jgi:hypothetical protein